MKKKHFKLTIEIYYSYNYPVLNICDYITVV